MGVNFPFTNILYPNPQLRTSLDFQMHLELQTLLPTAMVRQAVESNKKPDSPVNWL